MRPPSAVPCCAAFRDWRMRRSVRMPRDIAACCSTGSLCLKLASRRLRLPVSCSFVSSAGSRSSSMFNRSITSVRALSLDSNSVLVVQPKDNVLGPVTVLSITSRRFLPNASRQCASRTSKDSGTPSAESWGVTRAGSSFKKPLSACVPSKVAARITGGFLTAEIAQHLIHLALVGTKARNAGSCRMQQVRANVVGVGQVAVVTY